MNSDMKRIQKIAKDKGFSIRPARKKGHLEMVDANGKRMVGLASSPSDPNWWKTAIRNMHSKGILTAEEKAKYIRGGHL